MLLNFFSQETILSVRLHLINTKRCRQLPGPGPFFPLFSARWFAYENRIYWLCGQSYANRAGSSSVPGRLFRFSRPGGLRTKTDFIGFAGRRTQTLPAPWPLFLFFPARGLRTKTEFIGFAGRRTQTSPASGPVSLLPPARKSLCLRFGEQNLHTIAGR